MIPSAFRAFCGAMLFVALGGGCVPLHAQAPATPASSSQASPDAPKVQQFFMRLIPPRSTFGTDMTPQEQALMKQHADYWADQFKTGKVLIIGPVLDPKGVFGMAVLECTEAEAHTLADNDPSVKAGLNKIEVVPMRVFMRKQ